MTGKTSAGKKGRSDTMDGQELEPEVNGSKVEETTGNNEYNRYR